jgi:regulator of RNase E activity RraA
VIATHGHERGAVIGGNVALNWRLRGCEGVVTDGGIRDAEEFRAMGLPVCATFTGPMSNKGLWAFHDIGVAVELPGQRGSAVTIRPGDMVHADFDGVVIVPGHLAEQVVADAEVVEQMEGKIRADIEKGHDREEVYARYDRFGHIRQVTSA